MTAPQPDWLAGIPVVSSPYVPPGQVLFFGERQLVVLSTAPARPLSRRRRLARWLRALPHRLCPC